MSRTVFQKLKTLSNRLNSKTSQSSGYHWPEVDIVDYAQRAALGADDVDFPRILGVLMTLGEKKIIPIEIAEIAETVRRHSGRKDIE